METQINGKPAEWPEVVRARFDQLLATLRPDQLVTQANYFTSRPYRNEYDRGREGHGFVFTLNGREVCWINLAGKDLVSCATS